MLGIVCVWHINQPWLATKCSIGKLRDRLGTCNLASSTYIRPSREPTDRSLILARYLMCQPLYDLVIESLVNTNPSTHTRIDYYQRQVESRVLPRPKDSNLGKSLFVCTIWFSDVHVILVWVLLRKCHDTHFSHVLLESRTCYSTGNGKMQIVKIQCFKKNIDKNHPKIV